MLTLTSFRVSLSYLYDGSRYNRTISIDKLRQVLRENVDPNGALSSAGFIRMSAKMGSRESSGEFLHGSRIGAL